MAINDYYQKIDQAEARLGVQMEKIFLLLAQHQAVKVLKKEYQIYLQRISELYKLFFEKLFFERRSARISESDFLTQQTKLTEQYRRELIEFTARLDKLLSKQ